MDERRLEGGGGMGFALLLCCAILLCARARARASLAFSLARSLPRSLCTPLVCFVVCVLRDLGVQRVANSSKRLELETTKNWAFNPWRNPQAERACEHKMYAGFKLVVVVEVVVVWVQVLMSRWTPHGSFS